MNPSTFKEVLASTSRQTWPSVEPAALSSTATTRIASALLTAQHPLIVTSHLGRNPDAVSSLLALSSLLAIPVLPVCPSVVSVPHSHPFGLAPTFLTPSPPSDGGFEDALESPGAAKDLTYLSRADVILVVDADLTWIPALDQRPNFSARVFVLDGGDPLKTTVQMGWWRGEAEMICHADAEVALGQILDAVRESDVAGLITEGEDVKRRSRKLTQSWNRRVRDMEAVELDFTTNTQALIPDSPSSPLHTSFTVPNVIRTLREAIQRLTPSRGERTLILNETVTSFQIVWEHMRPEVPGNMLSSGGSSIGWALAAAVGANLGGTVPTESHSSPSLSSDSVDFTTAANGSGAGEGGGQQGNRFDLIVAIVGDGGFLFGIPSSVYWMARRYNTVRSKCLTFSVH